MERGTMVRRPKFSESSCTFFVSRMAFGSISKGRVNYERVFLVGPGGGESTSGNRKYSSGEFNPSCENNSLPAVCSWGFC